MLLDRMRILIEFGPEFLTPSERDRRLEEQLSGYFDVLAVGCLQPPGPAILDAAQERLDELGYSIYEPEICEGHRREVPRSDAEPQGDDREDRQTREEQRPWRATWLTAVVRLRRPDLLPGDRRHRGSDPTPRRAVCGRRRRGSRDHHRCARAGGLSDPDGRAHRTPPRSRTSAGSTCIGCPRTGG